MLSQLGIKAGILGHSRLDYDIMLMPIEPEESKEVIADKKAEETLLVRRFSMDIAVMVSAVCYSIRLRKI